MVDVMSRVSSVLSDTPAEIEGEHHSMNVKEVSASSTVKKGKI